MDLADARRYKHSEASFYRLLFGNFAEAATDSFWPQADMVRLVEWPACCGLSPSELHHLATQS